MYPVCLMNSYSEHCLAEIPEGKGWYFLKPVANYVERGPWFEPEKVSDRFLEKFIKTQLKKAGVVDKKITNH